VEEEIKMTHYMCRTPSPLRTTCPHLKNNPSQAQAIEASLHRMPGVLSVKASASTGNLFIHYDPSRIGHESLLKSLQHTQLKAGPMPMMHRPRSVHFPDRSYPASASRVSHAATNKLGEMLVGMLVEKCIERSTIALVGALL
jgi:copper chaperone CopZ